MEYHYCLYKKNLYKKIIMLYRYSVRLLCALCMVVLWIFEELRSNPACHEALPPVRYLATQSVYTHVDVYHYSFALLAGMDLQFMDVAFLLSPPLLAPCFSKM